MPNLVTLLATVLYLIAAALSWRDAIAHPQGSGAGRPLARVIAGTALLLHTVDLTAILRNEAGFALTIGDALSLWGWVIAASTLAAGFAALTVALFTGLVFVYDLKAQHLSHKLWLSVLAWTLFAILLIGRARYGWRGRTAARFTVGGFLALSLAYLGSKFVLEVVLGRHWG